MFCLIVKILSLDGSIVIVQQMNFAIQKTIALNAALLYMY